MFKTLSSSKNTWLSYLHSLKDCPGEKAQVHLTDFNLFLNANTFTDSFFRHSIPFVYLLDYRRSAYVHMSENFAGYKADSFFKSGINHTLDIFHRSHLKLFNEEVFPQRLEILKTICPGDFKSYVFSYNIRVRNRNGRFENYLQRNCYLSDEIGNPVFSMGILININDHIDSKRVLQTVDRLDVNGIKDNETIHTAVYCLNDDDKLFSKREKEVLLWMADGFSSKMIAGKLNISEHTVINHRRSMQEKSNMPNATALVSFAIRSAII